MRVLVADDHALLRQGLIQLLRSEYADWSFAEAADLPGVLAALALGGQDLMILDLRMPGMAGGDSLRALRAAHPATLLVVLSGVDERAVILECLNAGVNGYMLKSMAAEAMLAALRVVIDGHVFVPPGLARLVPPPDAAPASALSHNFTGRQSEVLNLLAEGHSTKDIARALNLGVGTVKVHLAAIYRILGAHNRMEAVVRAGALRR